MLAGSILIKIVTPVVEYKNSGITAGQKSILQITPGNCLTMKLVLPVTTQGSRAAKPEMITELQLVFITADAFTGKSSSQNLITAQIDKVG